MAHSGLRYLSRRGDQFQIRLVIPKDLHWRVGRKELRWSLKTSDRTTARRRPASGRLPPGSKPVSMGGFTRAGFLFEQEKGC